MSTSEPLNILLVEDNPDELGLLRYMVSDLATITCVSDSRLAVAKALESEPALVITDLYMPELSGLELCKAIKAEPSLAETAVIVVTSASSEYTEVEVLEAGAVDFITKPLRPPVVRARVNTQLLLAEQRRELKELADRDGLTQVGNRRYLETHLNKEIRRHLRQHQPLAVALIDVDHFKPYNDHYGHVDGDRVLKTVANAINAGARRPGECVARYGGEEFATVLPNTNAAGAHKYGQWLCEQIRALKIPHAYSETSSVVTVSVGIAAIEPGTNTTAEDYFTAADEALYRAKHGGRNRARLSKLADENVREVI